MVYVWSIGFTQESMTRKNASQDSREGRSKTMMPALLCFFLCSVSRTVGGNDGGFILNAFNIGVECIINWP